MIAAMLDLTERNRVGAQFRAVFQGANIGIVQFDPRTVRAFAVNAKLCEIWGAPESEILGHSLARWTPPEDDDDRAALHARLADRGDPAAPPGEALPPHGRAHHLGAGQPASRSAWAATSTPRR